MGRYLLRIEGVNFASTLYDTSDLSTVRGASLGLLRAYEVAQEALKACAIECDIVFSGASQAVISFEAPAEGKPEDAADAVRAALSTTTPYKYLSFVIDVADTLPVVEARNRTRQFRQWTVDLPEYSPGIERYDSKRDRTRPASKRLGSNSADNDVSASVKARHDFGREMRQDFYAKEVQGAAEGLSFANSFADIVGDPPKEELPRSLWSKMALVYADGNQFGSIRESLIEDCGGDPTAAWKRFSCELQEKRSSLLEALVSWYGTSVVVPSQKGRFVVEQYGEEKGVSALRLETLLWGGDEFLFVMPSWLAFAFVEGFFRLASTWEIAGQKLTHSAGVVICHHKMPVRQAKKLAEDRSVDTCKMAIPDGSPQNAVSIAIFESQAPFDTDLGEYRSTLYRARDEKEALASELVLPGDKFDEILQAIDAAKKDEAHLPRSQIYALLRLIRARGGFFSTEALEAVQTELSRYTSLAGAHSGASPTDLNIPGLTGERKLSFSLALLSEFWDYSSPFPTQLPEFPGARR